MELALDTIRIGFGHLVFEVNFAANYEEKSFMEQANGVLIKRSRFSPKLPKT